MICYHGYDSHEACPQCPKDAVKTRRRLEALIRARCEPPRDELIGALNAHDSALQEAGARESERLHGIIRRLQAELQEVQEEAQSMKRNDEAILESLSRIESALNSKSSPEEV